MNAPLASLLLTLLLAWPLSARAEDEPARPVDDACYNELGILCRGAEGTAALNCLERYSDSLTPSCREAVKSERETRRKRSEQAAQERAAAAAVAAAGSAATTELEARLVKASGSVYVHTSRQPAEQFIRAEEGMPLEPGDIVRTGSDGAAEISLDGESLFSLASNTDFAVKSLKPDDAQLFLGLGRLVAKVRKLMAGQRMRFSTPAAVAAVRGTELAIEQPEGDQPARVGVLDEGRVEVTRPEGGPGVTLSPNQETDVARGKPPTPPKPLAALLTAKSSIAPLRGRLTEVRRQWKKRTLIERETQRVQLAQKAPLPALNLPHVGPAQRQRTYGEALQKRSPASAPREPAAPQRRPAPPRR